MRRTAIVTGASRGIGLAVATHLLAEGYAVVGCASSPGAAHEALARLEGPAIGVDADVTQEPDVERMVGVALERFGGVDALVNNAGVYEPDPFLDSKREQWSRTLEVNVIGPMLCSQAAARAMIASDARQRGGGRIVNIASSTGILSEPGATAYNASKAALISLTKSLAEELAEHGIATNCVAPGWVDTGIDPELDEYTEAQLRLLNPMGRAGSPEEVAYGVAALCDPHASFISGAVLSVDGGQTAVSPRPTDR